MVGQFVLAYTGSSTQESHQLLKNFFGKICGNCFFSGVGNIFFEFSLLELACLLTTEGGEVCDFYPLVGIEIKDIYIINKLN